MRMRTAMSPADTGRKLAKTLTVCNLEAVAPFWDPLMAFLGWRRADDGIGAVVYEGRSAAVLFTSGEVWDQAHNEVQRSNAFAHLAFDVAGYDELASLARSLDARAAVPSYGPRRVFERGRWLWALGFRDPNGLDVEVRCPA